MGFNLLNDTQRQAYIAETNGWDLQKRKQLQNTFVYVLVFNLPFFTKGQTHCLTC